jgi:hypothetical protein
MILYPAPVSCFRQAIDIIKITLVILSSVEIVNKNFMIR